ncbi:MAG: sigma-54 dependent transcriptional regulator [Acidobacteriota bacterium]
MIIDDDINFSKSLKEYISTEFIEVYTASSGEEGLEACSQRMMDVVLLDQKLPDWNGDELCPLILQYNEDTKIIFITAYPSFDHALKAIKAGAHDYLSKPFDPEELIIAINRSFKITSLEKAERVQIRKNRKESEESILLGAFGNKIDIHNLIDISASTDSPVLITGETGTGKNMVAKAIHFRGKDKDAPFFTLNCAALPENLIEAELFGHEKGAFTGAEKTRRGVFEISEGGTLFLDEIGTMAYQLQSKLLGVLDELKIKRLGSEVIRDVNTRIISATNADLFKMIEEKSFRQDLYYRLGVILIELPPLRERLDDIPALIENFIKKIAPGKVIKLAASEIDKLMDYHWPGNIRELRNVIERSIFIFKDPITPSLLIEKKNITSTQAPKEIDRSENKNIRTLAEVESDHIKYILDINGWNLTRSSRKLGISLSTLKRKIKNLTRPD